MAKLLSIVVLAGFPLLATAQLQVPMEYVDEVGPVGWQDQRTSVDLGLATVYHECVECEANTASDQLRFEGQNDAGKLWRLWIPRVGGFGGTEIWKADFDKNGRRDLLITSYFIQNGRCTDEFDMVFALFDEKGHPAVSKITTHGFSGFEVPPAVVVDVNGDGRAEVVTTICTYSEPPRFGENRQITGIYEAREGRWVPQREAEEGPYLEASQALVKARLMNPNALYYDPEYLKWVPMEPDKWPESLEGPANARGFVPYRLDLPPE